MPSDLVDVFRSVENDRLRLALPIGAAFPKETSADKWTKMATMTKNDLGAEGAGRIDERGYHLYELRMTFTEGSGSPPNS